MTMNRPSSRFPVRVLSMSLAATLQMFAVGQPRFDARTPPAGPDARQWPGAAIGGHRLAPFFRASAHRRVDILGIGDSNHVYFGHGWEEGWNTALSVRSGVYGTGLHTFGEGSGNGSGIGHRCGVFSTINSGVFEYGDSGTAFDRFMNGTVRPTGNSNYIYLPPGAEASSFNVTGLFLSSNSPIRASGDVRFQYVIGRFEDSIARIRPIIRVNEFPYSLLVQSEPISMAGPNDLAVLELSIDDAPAADIGFQLALPGGPDYEAPLLALYVSADDPQRAYGYAYHVLYYGGGSSLRTMAGRLNALDPAQLELFMSLTADGQRDEAGPLTLVRINSGLNDLRSIEPSFVAGIVPGSSPEAYEDNLRAIIAELSARWRAAGLADESLYFLITPSHPIGGSDARLLARYGDIAEQVALSLPRAACVRLDRLTDPSEMVERGWYRAADDRYHLTQPGYIELSQRELEALERWCPGDWTGDDAFDSADIVQFLGDWERGEADADQDGSTDSEDVVYFLQLWDSSGC